VSEVFAQKSPPLFQLEDILNEKLPRFYYREELTKSAPLSYNKDYFLWKKIIKTKIVKGEKLCLVKYLHYSDKAFKSTAFNLDLKLRQ